MNGEQLREIITIIGEDQIEKVYSVTKGEKVSFATLHKQILLDKVRNQINHGRSFRQIAIDFKLSRMTIYRIFRKRKVK